MAEFIVTEEDLLKNIQAWVKKKGRQPTTAEVRQIYADMVEAGSAQTEEERNRQEEKEKQPLTESGITSIVKQLTGATATSDILQPTAMAAIPRVVSGDFSNTIDPITGMPYTNLTQQRRGSMTTWTYSGENLVDENGKIVNVNTTDNTNNAAANVLIQQLNQQGTLASFLQTLKSHQHYGDRSPSEMALRGQGATATDYAAIDSFINSANLARYTPSAYMKILASTPAVAGSGSGSSVSYPNSADTSRYLRNAAFEAFGRPLTMAEAKVAFQAVRSAYAKASGSGGESAPSLESATQQAVAQISGEEGAIYNLGLALDRMFKGGGSI